MKLKIAAAALLCALPLSASAITWVTSGNDDSNLYTIDETTGAIISTVGDTGEFFTGLAYEVSTGTLIGTSSPNSPTPSSVFRIDPNTAAATLIGAHGGDQAVIDLSFAPDGTLYGWLEPSRDDLVTIDLTTGAATILGESPGSSGRTIEFTPSGEVALFNLSLATILDPVTGLATGETIPLTGSGSINASYRISTGEAYAIGLPSGGSGPRTLNVISFVTGVVTELGEIPILNASGITSDFLDPTLNPDDPAFGGGAVSDVTFGGANFAATVDQNVTGYYIVVPTGATAPTAEQIKAGVNYGDVTVVAAGSQAMTADVEVVFPLTGLDQGVTYDLYFVGESDTPAFTDVTSETFTTLDDDDGVSPSVEDAAPNNGDGNSDGTDDAEQSSVSSLPITEGGYATVVSVADRALSNVTETPTLPAPLPADAFAPYGAFGFVANGITAGATEEFQLFLPLDPGITGALKWNSDASQWDTIGTVSVVGGSTVITFSIVEGGAYDSDSDNTTITDPIVPLGTRSLGPDAIPATPLWALGMLILGVLGVTVRGRRRA